MFKQIVKKIQRTTDVKLSDNMYYYASLVNAPELSKTTIMFINDETQAEALNIIREALVSHKDYAILKRDNDQNRWNLLESGMTVKDIQSKIFDAEFNMQKVIVKSDNKTLYFGLSKNNELLIKNKRSDKHGYKADSKSLNITQLKILSN
ncbi:hypothetical protein A0H77_19500 [Vibrio alginolyticus]|uniref:hypothetical protein n=1 Tax=Vibrio alginolyticus TaxID=663 RepID=UPI00079B7961|nr:hypothetical protein [Vibrio alginolyticus]KXZ35084.1 hypothetical protein A0H77_19500 [Vibrio alginolyticus]